MTATKRLLFASIGIIFHVALTFAQASDFEPTGNSRTLVAYFSATGNTRTVAQRIAELTGSDIYEIQPQRPYAENPYDDSQLIQNEAYNDLRPAVANLSSEETIARYDTIYVGSPLWWHQPAMVVCTFLEAYDLSGKIVVPFITYGATTYLNEAMQKLFKCTPNSIHVPATLPVDIAPDNIREPQNDDEGIYVPNRPSQVEDWLERMGLWPPKESGIDNIGTDNDQNCHIRNIPGGISVLTSTPINMSVYDLSGQTVFSTLVESKKTITLPDGIYIVKTQSRKNVKSRKIIVGNS